MRRHAILVLLLLAVAAPGAALADEPPPAATKPEPDERRLWGPPGPLRPRLCALPWPLHQALARSAGLDDHVYVVRHPADGKLGEVVFVQRDCVMARYVLSPATLDLLNDLEGQPA